MASAHGALQGLIAAGSTCREVSLRTLLWLDAFLGGSTGLIGLSFGKALVPLLGLPLGLIRFTSVVTLGYALVALTLARQRTICFSAVRKLVAANWLWAIVSMAMLGLFGQGATALGRVFLVLQVVVVGALAYLEGLHED